MNKNLNLTGRRFGKLVVLGCEGSDRQGRKWLCQCDCGNQKVVYGKNLKRGVKSCGCLRGPSTSRSYFFRPTDDDFFEGEGITALRTAILNQAVVDYRQGNSSKKDYLEKWFLSEWGQLLSGDMGEVIVEKLKKGE